MDTMSHEFIDHMDQNAGRILSTVPEGFDEVVVYFGDEHCTFTRLELAQWAVRAAEDKALEDLFEDRTITDPDWDGDDDSDWATAMDAPPPRVDQLALAVHEQAMAIIRLNDSLIKAGALDESDAIFYDTASALAATLIEQ